MNIDDIRKMHIEGTVRLQDNVLLAKSRYGTTFECKIISTKYFKFMGNDSDVPTLVCCKDESLVLGKPSNPEYFTKEKYKVTLIDNIIMGVYHIYIL